MNLPTSCPKPAPRERGHVRVKRVNPERKQRRFEEAFHSEAFCAWVRSLGCSVPECGSHEIEVAHATSRGAGGDWTGALPMCRRHHALSHSLGIRTFERRVGFELADVAACVHRRWLAFVKGAE